MDFQTLKKLSQDLTLLLVEDNDDLRESLQRNFSKYFKHVDTAIDGADALKCYNDYKKKSSNYYDIVISDILMPNLNGIEMTKAIFKIHKNQKIIIISAHSDKNYLIDLINIGVDSFIQKPLINEEILQTLHKVCSEFHNNDIIELGEGYFYNSLLKALFLDLKKINLSDKELTVLDLLLTNTNQSFSAEDIFNFIYFDQVEKEFSSDSIRSLFKRLRKKLPDKLIVSNHQIGYSINHDLLMLK